MNRQPSYSTNKTTDFVGRLLLQIDWVKVLHPSQCKTGHLGDVLPSQSLQILQ